MVMIGGGVVIVGFVIGMLVGKLGWKFMGKVVKYGVVVVLGGFVYYVIFWCKGVVLVLSGDDYIMVVVGFVFFLLFSEEDKLDVWLKLFVCVMIVVVKVDGLVSEFECDCM